jgi:lysophospholipase L1-like esterase
MGVRIRNGETILFIGDSITDCDRRTSQRPLGNGYVKLFADLLTIREPDKRVVIINKGIGGDRITDLRARWDDDVMRYRSDWLSVKIGINDLHHYLDERPTAVPPEMFRRVYDEILSRTHAAMPKTKLLLIDPFYLSTDRSTDSFRAQVLKVLPRYIAAVHAMSRKYNARLVRTHEMFQKILRYNPMDYFAPEPVHPYANGHLALALWVYAALSR